MHIFSYYQIWGIFLKIAQARCVYIITAFLMTIAADTTQPILAEREYLMGMEISLSMPHTKQ